MEASDGACNGMILEGLARNRNCPSLDARIKEKGDDVKFTAIAGAAMKFRRPTRAYTRILDQLKSEVFLGELHSKNFRTRMTRILTDFLFLFYPCESV